MKQLVPRAWRQFVRRRLHGAVYSGDYASWADAIAASGGYDSAVIFERTLRAARAVRAGEAQWERDTVLFHAAADHAPLLSALRQAAAANRGCLVVMDLGGALGSTWWQHRRQLEGLAEVRWSIVEQATLVVAGQREFTTGPLRFYETVDACCVSEQPAVAVLSSVLPYLENPHEVLQDIADRSFRHIIIDRTGFVARGPDRLTVQRVPESIYPGSYPCWFFDRASLLRPLMRNWRVVAEWPGFDQADIPADFHGIMLERNEA